MYALTATQVFQNLLFERVKNTYEASLHCVILAALLQLRILGLCSTERGHANRAFVLESEETGGFPPNLLCGLELLQQTFQTYRVSGDANNIWEPLLVRKNVNSVIRRSAIVLRLLITILLAFGSKNTRYWIRCHRVTKYTKKLYTKVTSKLKA